MEDEKIVALYLERDEGAISASAEKYGARLRLLAHSITGDAQTAEECENDTYLQAWNHIPPHEPKDYLYAFLARITRHISLDRCREHTSLKRKGYVTELGEELELCLPALEDIESTVAAEELGRAVSRFLQSVSQEKRVIFVRRYFYMDSIAEISKRCGSSQSRVKSSLFRTRKELRNYLLKEGYIL